MSAIKPKLNIQPIKNKLKPGLSRVFNLFRVLPRVLNKKEKIFFLVFFTAFLASGIYLMVSSYLGGTMVAPANGGILREGILGQPRFINPIYAASNDVDRDLVNLIYSGLFKYDSAGEIVPDLVREYSIENDGKLYNLTLKENIVFHDGEPLTADDVIFTIKTIQSPDFKSPIQAKWLDVKAEKVSQYQITITLKNAYPAFLETLCLRIMPSHIWSEVSAENFPLSSYNFKPIGSGPFQLQNITQDKGGRITSINLTKFPDYYGQLPHINQINFLFFEEEKELLRAAENNIIDALSLPSGDYKSVYNLNEYSFVIPRYFALFFNPTKSEFLTQDTIRRALNLAVNKQEIKEKILSNKGAVIESPFLLNIYSPKSTSSPGEFNLDEAKELLNKAGFVEQDGKLMKIKSAETMNFVSNLSSGSKGKTVEYLQQCLAKFSDIYPDGEISGFFGAKTKEAVIKFQEKYADEILKPSGLSSGNGVVGPSTREKLNEVCVISLAENTPFKIRITTPVDPMLQKTAELLKEQWAKIGIETEINALSITEIKQTVIKEREYETLLFGQVLGIIPDPYPFWHSGQRIYPGLNLADYKNTKVDKLLEQTRTSSDKNVLIEKMGEAENLLRADTPAIFLFNPDFIYLASSEIKGIETHIISDPSQRFAGIADWYIKTKRVLK
ncbi:peptidoglycan-binding protein [Patescibacteria group bacterium]|nr:peptidoglycan-binding protein [Patescibacteria group bacterium]